MATVVNLKLKGLTLRGKQETKKHTITIDKDFKLKRTSLADLQKIKSNLNWELAFPNGTKQTRKEQVDNYITDNSDDIIWPLMIEFDWQSCLDWKVVSLGEKKKKKTTTAITSTATPKEKKAEKEEEKLNSLLQVMVEGDKMSSDMYYEFLAVHKDMKEAIKNLSYERQFSIVMAATGVAAQAGSVAYKEMGDIISGRKENPLSKQLKENN